MQVEPDRRDAVHATCAAASLTARGGATASGRTSPAARRGPSPIITRPAPVSAGRRTGPHTQRAPQWPGAGRKTRDRCHRVAADSRGTHGADLVDSPSVGARARRRYDSRRFWPPGGNSLRLLRASGDWERFTGRWNNVTGWVLCRHPGIGGGRELSRERLIPTQCAQGNCVLPARLLAASERSGGGNARAGRYGGTRRAGTQDCRGGAGEVDYGRVLMVCTRSSTTHCMAFCLRICPKKSWYQTFSQSSSKSWLSIRSVEHLESAAARQQDLVAVAGRTSPGDRPTGQGNQPGHCHGRIVGSGSGRRRPDWTGNQHRLSI